MDAEGDVGHRVDAVVDAGVGAAAEPLAPVFLSVGLDGGGVERAVEGGVVVFAVGGRVPALAAGVVVAEVSAEVDGEAFVGPGVANPRGDRGLRVAVDAEADEMVAFDVGGGDDIDDRFGAGGVFGGGVGDGLDAGERVGGERLEVGLEVFLGEARGFVVHPDFHAAGAAERDIAFHIHLDAWGVLEGVACGAGLDGGVIADVVDHFLAVHGVERAFGGDFHLLQLSGAWFDPERAECGVVGDVERDDRVAVADSGDAEEVAACGDAADFEVAVQVGRAALDEGAVHAVEHSHIDEGDELAGDGVAEGTDDLEGRALFDVLLLADGLRLLGGTVVLHPFAELFAVAEGGTAVRAGTHGTVAVSAEAAVSAAGLSEGEAAAQKEQE